jgi:DNA polymerase
MSDTSDDFAELVRDAAAYVSYLRDLGVVDAGGGAPEAPASPRPAAAAEVSTPAAPVQAAPVQAAPLQAAPEPVPEAAMASKKTEPPSLFGDDVAPLEGVSEETLEQIRADIGECIRCKLCEGRTKIVYGEGDAAARLMFVGEGPGADEDAMGRPFVGRAGQLLDKIIAAIGLKRENVFIDNVVKCRPPGNRKPERDESQTCQQFLFRQIAVIKPKVIVALGNTPAEALLGVKGGITKLRGQFYDYHGIKVMPTFHPAYLLRDPTKKREVWEDMKKVKAELGI